VKMRVHEASALRLKDANPSWIRAQVRGSVESEVQPGKGSVDVEVEGSDARAHSQGGHFFVTADGRGVVAVAAVTGSVNLTSHGKQVEVKPGTVSRAEGGRLEDASPALRRVLLAVRWPQERATSKDTVPVSGKVEAGSRVFIQGQPVPWSPAAPSAPTCRSATASRRWRWSPSIRWAGASRWTPPSSGTSRRPPSG